MSARLAFAACALLALDPAAGTRVSTGSPFVPGMDKAVALALAGPGAYAGVLCGGIDAVMVERGAASVMAGFVDARVSEIEAIDAARAPAACADSFRRGYVAAVARWGAPAEPVAEGTLGTASTRSVRFALRGAVAELLERRFPDGSCDVRLLVRAGADA